MSELELSSVTVVVPAAEPVVARHRQRLDVTAGWGVPAHVTVLYPFVEPAQIDDDVMRRLRAAVGAVGAFDYEFRRTGWFRDDAMWLAPEPDEGFRRLTRLVREQFPDCAPYDGAYPEPTPHLTVGTTTENSLDDVRRAEALVSAQLPIVARVEAVALMAGNREPNSWQVLEEFPLAAVRTWGPRPSG
jgi:2'-5' RNA ligase